MVWPTAPELNSATDGAFRYKGTYIKRKHAGRGGISEATVECGAGVRDRAAVVGSDRGPCPNGGGRVQPRTASHFT